jgi:hypothetical protein
MPNLIEKRIVGTWMHSREEDEPGIQVFRPASYDFPPARGREGFEFRADHGADFLGISPRDGSARSTCTWRIRAGNIPELVVVFPDGRSEAFCVVSAERDRLVLRRP